MLVATSRQIADVDTRIKILVDMLAKRDTVPYKAHKKFAKEHFMPIHDAFYLHYVASQRKHIREIAYSNNYVYIKINKTDREYNDKYYTVGIDSDSDRLFINRVNYANIEGYLINAETIGDSLIVMRVKESFFKERVFEYSVDILDDEYVVDIGPHEFMTYRVQGDLQLVTHKYPNDFTVLGAIDRQAAEYREYLIADKICALLSDYGISYQVRKSDGTHFEIIIPGGTDSSRWSKYSRRNRLKLLKLLTEYFTIESDSSIVDDGVSTTVRLRDGDTRFSIDIISRAYFSDWIGDVIIRTQGEFDFEKRRVLVDDAIKQLDKLEPIDMIRQIGNHRITLKNVVPVSVAYTPPIKPLVLDPLTLYIVVPNAYIVTCDSVIEFSHREHGKRIVKFADKYIVRITHNSVHVNDTAQRNRVVLSRIEPYKL